jgi:hypothetical protein
METPEEDRVEGMADVEVEEMKLKVSVEGSGGARV